MKNHLTFDEIFDYDAKIDFHQFGPLRDFEIQTHLEHFLEDNYSFGYSKLLVITGKGKVVRPSVEKILKNHQYVEAYSSGGYFNGQDGVFEVILRN